MFSNVIRSYIAMSSIIVMMINSAPTIMAKSDRPLLGVISIGMTELEVQKHLGKPLKKSHSQCGRDHLEYIKGKVGLQNDNVYYITTQSRDWKTKEGVRVGDNISKVQNIYNLRKTDSLTFESAIQSGEKIYFGINSSRKVVKIELRASSVC
jgi:hypothetical protein